MKNRYVIDFLSREFGGKNYKEAYQKATRWYATNIISKGEFEDVSVSYTKVKEYPAIVMKLFVSVDENTLTKEHCKVCREAHRLFYMNDINCQNCNVSGYQKRCKSLLSVKSSCYREKLKNATDFD